MNMASSIHHVLVFLVIFLKHSSTLATKKTYIVYLGTHQHGLNPTKLDVKTATQSHYNLMKSVMGSYEKAQESILHSYNKYINGFVAELSEDEVERTKKSSNVVSVFENRRLELTTTRSWEFLGLEQNGATPIDSLWNISNYGNDTIIANIDTGVWPESESFKDYNFGPVPSRWKGGCEVGSDATFKCNKKLIGAKYLRVVTNKTQTFNQSEIFLSPRDTYGHGTHTLSTAGGNFVKGVSVFGYGNGDAKGGSPNARVAAYRVGWPDTGLNSADILAAFESAIGDGVDVLSVSIGDPQPDFNEDVIVIGAFHAIRHGIAVVASAGNDGNKGPGKVSNTAPWIFTVAASTIDRDFYNEVYLGNSTLHFKGADFGGNKLPNKQFYPIIDGASAVANSSTTDKAQFCFEGSLDPSKVKGKIVICRIGGMYSTWLKGEVIRAAGGVGMITANNERLANKIYGFSLLLPASHLSYNDSQVIFDYINKTTNPTAYITEVKTTVGLKPAPVMADFSSRGPCARYPYILKPDITAPGVNIIAAFTGAIPPTDYENDTRRIKYNIMSGTSMSAPHVAGIVGLVKSIHPDWSPAAIQSALMTTATTFGNDNKGILDSDGHLATPFAYGAGHINPNAAADPGLIYNLTEHDYLEYLCSLGSFTEKDIKIFTPIPCTNKTNILNFNYPSITVTNFTSSAILTRVVTNVGNPGTYEAKVSAPSGVNITVIPSKLSFNRTGEEQSFSVEVKAFGEKPTKPEYVFGSLTWSDGKHNVRSPLVVQRI